MACSIELMTRQSRDEPDDIEQESLIAMPQTPHRYTTASLSQRLAPLAAAVIFSFASAAICYIWRKGIDFQADSAFYKLSTTHRNSVQVGVHIVSSTLGILWSLAVSSTFNLVQRASVAKKPVTLTSVRLYAALSKQFLELELPWAQKMISVVVYAVALLPAWLWTGALTPQIATGNIDMVLPIANTRTWLVQFPPPMAHGTLRGMGAGVPFKSMALSRIALACTLQLNCSSPQGLQSPQTTSPGLTLSQITVASSTRAVRMEWQVSIGLSPKSSSLGPRLAGYTGACLQSLGAWVLRQCLLYIQRDIRLGV